MVRKCHFLIGWVVKPCPFPRSYLLRCQASPGGVATHHNGVADSSIHTPEIVVGEGQSHPGEHSSTRQEIALWDFERPPKMMSPNPSFFPLSPIISPPLPFLMRYPDPPLPLCLHNHLARSSPPAFSCHVRPVTYLRVEVNNSV